MTNVFDTAPAAEVNGCLLYDDGLGGLTAYRGDTLNGTAFPHIVAQPDGEWFARRRGETAIRFTNRATALTWLTRENPDA